MTRLKLLGGLTVAGEAAAADAIANRRHPLALLALLATAPGRTMSRSRLIALLWPDVQESAARNRLTSCVYEVRSALGGDVLLGRGAELTLNASVIHVDVWELEAAVEAGDAGRAVGLYAGPYLDGFFCSGAAELEQRIDVERERLLRLYRSALERLAEDAWQRGERERAAEWWRRRAQNDPLDSRIAALLIGALAACGRRTEALRVADQHVRTLRDELGAAPDPKCQSLIGEIRSGASDGAAFVSREAQREEAQRPLAELPLNAVAVLPFTTEGGSPQLELFAAGLHADLVTELSRSEALTIIARMSVERYRGSGLEIGEIARQLGAGTIVEGTVRSANERVRLHVQLIDARSGTHRWVERYDRRLAVDDIFDVQSELAAKIARTLDAELAPPVGTAVRREPTSNLEAFSLYTRGRALLDQRTPMEMTRSVDYFRQALALDADYALAWAGLADALAVLEFYDCELPSNVPDALDAARAAIERDPQLGAAHASLGIVLAVRVHVPDAVTALARAVELAPGHAEAHAWLGWLHLLRGAPEAAVVSAQRSVELDPLAPAFRAYLAEALLAVGDDEAALREVHRARAMRPSYVLPAYIEALILYHRHAYGGAASALHEALEQVRSGGSPTRAEVLTLLAVTNVAAGRREEAGPLLARLRAGSDRFSEGLLQAALGDHDDALSSFEAVSSWSAFSVEHLRYFFPDVLGPLRSSPRYAAILRRLDASWSVEA